MLNEDKGKIIFETDSFIIRETDKDYFIKPKNISNALYELTKEHKQVKGLLIIKSD